MLKAEKLALCAVAHGVLLLGTVAAQEPVLHDGLIVRADRTALRVGETLQLHVVLPQPDGSERDVTTLASGTAYNLSTPSVVGVSLDGLVTALAPGRVTI